MPAGHDCCYWSCQKKSLLRNVTFIRNNARCCSQTFPCLPLERYLIAETHSKFVWVLSECLLLMGLLLAVQSNCFHSLKHCKFPCNDDITMILIQGEKKRKKEESYFLFATERVMHICKGQWFAPGTECHSIGIDLVMAPLKCTYT